MAIRPAGARISEFFGDKPDYSALGNQATADAARGEVNTALNNARSAATSMKAQADIQAAEHWADATRETGAIQGQSAMASGIASAVGGLGSVFSGGGISGGGGGGSEQAASYGSQGLSPGTGTPISDFFTYGS